MIGVCRSCGCTEDSPCLLDREGTVIDEGREELVELEQLVAGACSWLEPDLCSACVEDAAPALLVDVAGRPLRGAP